MMPSPCAQRSIRNRQGITRAIPLSIPLLSQLLNLFQVPHLIMQEPRVAILIPDPYLGTQYIVQFQSPIRSHQFVLTLPPADSVEHFEVVRPP